MAREKLIKTSDIKTIPVDTFFMPSGAMNIVYIMMKNHNNGFADVVYINFTKMSARVELNKDFRKSKKTERKLDVGSGEWKDVVSYEKPEFSIKSKKWVFDKIFRRLNYSLYTD